MAWVAINKDYAANDETTSIVTRTTPYTGMEEDLYIKGDDPLTELTNQGRAYHTLDERVNDLRHGGCTRVTLPYGVGYEDAIDMIRFYGRI
ncbi:hypothetical protein QJ043_08370 [Olsenella sp. YH-ols2217]|uniref:Uncharacterized protein n=1 Tax=Kribbibacterium absianum TaxID=3044210 RepID=A0ABT6ZM02_9ACTN|nr:MULTISPECIES: hypothetical protein [unclassified Olsenella]MDJ1122078.1 hypothetical protein [Olsenella sp. YH-ols2216]MDJ1130086.1 hypothetical protein [Olsenella sp. YH-ols2217]